MGPAWHQHILVTLHDDHIHGVFSISVIAQAAKPQIPLGALRRRLATPPASPLVSSHKVDTVSGALRLNMYTGFSLAVLRLA